MDFNSFMNENKIFFYNYIYQVFSNYSDIQQSDVDFVQNLNSIVKKKLSSKQLSSVDPKAEKKRKTAKQSSVDPVVETPKAEKKRKTAKQSSVDPVVETPKKSFFQKKLQDIPNKNYDMEYLSDNAFDPYDSD